MNKFTKNFLSFVLLLTLTFLLASCEGDEGPAGPTGPAGPAGEDAEFTIVTVSFTGAEAGISGDWSFYDVAVPEITQEVLDNGAILLYLNESMTIPINDKWGLMPLSLDIMGATFNFGAIFSPGSVTFSFTTTTFDWIWLPDTVYTYKIVILSEPVKSGVNVEKFEDVRAHYQEELLEIQ